MCEKEGNRDNQRYFSGNEHVSGYARLTTAVIVSVKISSLFIYLH